MEAIPPTRPDDEPVDPIPVEPGPEPIPQPLEPGPPGVPPDPMPAPL